MPKQLPSLIVSDEQLEAVADLAACNYSPEKIALYLQVEKAAFMSHWFDSNSPVREAYDGGQLRAEFEINQKQLEMARAGNITAAQIFLKESAATKIENLKKQCLFGE